MDLADFHRLLTPVGQRALTAATALDPTDATLLASHQTLRKQFPEDLARSAIETVRLRQKAVSKFTRAATMYFTRAGLEQSSGETIAAYRAERFAGFDRVGDLCCGIGGDAIGLANSNRVLAVDIEPLRLAMAAENVRAYGQSDRVEFLEGDVLRAPIAHLDGAFFDPDRRADGKRHIRVREYVPALGDVAARFSVGFPLAVKAAPGAPWDELRTFDAEAEFISVAGELKECVLWFGPPKSVGRRATVLPARATIAVDQPAQPDEPGPPLAYLYDPDPAVVRSGLVSDLGRLLDARPIDPDIAYLTGEVRHETPFATTYQVDEVLPFHARRIGERLKAMNVGHVTLTKRGSAVDVDSLRRSWKLTGTEARTVILTRVLGRPTAIIARRLYGEARPRPVGSGPHLHQSNR